MPETQLEMFLADEELRAEADALDPTPEFNESWFEEEIVWSNAA